MKLYHYSILFSILFVGVMTMAYAGEMTDLHMEKERQIMDRSVDEAADAAAGYLATHSDGRLFIDKEEVLEVFFLTLFSSLGVLDRIPEQERLRGYIACIILLDKDGYFLWHTRREEENVFGWEEKVFFIDGEREKQLEEVVLKAVEEQKELRNYYGKNYQFELPIGEGFLKRGVAERGVFVLLRGIPGRGGGKMYEHFAFSGSALYKVNP